MCTVYQPDATSDWKIAGKSFVHVSVAVTLSLTRLLLLQQAYPVRLLTAMLYDGTQTFQLALLLGTFRSR